MGLQYKGKFPPYWLLVWTVTVIGLQGFFNSLVYFRPVYVSLRDNYSRRDSLSMVLGISSKESLHFSRTQKATRLTSTGRTVTGADATTSSNRGTSSISAVDNQSSLVMPSLGGYADKSCRTASTTNDYDYSEKNNIQVEGEVAEATRRNSCTDPVNDKATNEEVLEPEDNDDHV